MPYIDKEKKREYDRKWNKSYYANNKKVEIARVTKRKKQLRAWLDDYRKGLVCKRCGEDHPACLDFHHTDSKSKDLTIGNIKAMGWSQKKVLLEIQKCVVICANCHRKLHANERTVK